MQPISVTLSSTGSSPWKLVNWHANPINLGIMVSVASLSSTWQIDVTLADPTNTYPSSAVAVFQSSQVGGPAASSINSIGAIIQPIAAWRLTNNSTGGAVTATVLQSGIG